MDFEGVKSVIIEYNYGYGSKTTTTYERDYISTDDLKTLGKRLKTSATPFEGFKGKLFFPKSTKFPRYKFREYSLANNGVVSRVIDAKNADAVVMDVPSMKALLKQQIGNEETYHVVGETKGKPLYVKKEDLGKRKSLDIVQECYVWHASQLEDLCEVYRQYQVNPVPFVDVSEITKVLGQQYDAIDGERAEHLLALCKSQDRDSIKTGMEVLTNCDIDKSILHIMLLFSQAGQNMKSHSYWNSVSFKTFREACHAKEVYVENVFGHAPVSVVQQYLKSKKTFLFDDDIPYIKKLIRDQVEAQISLETTGYKLTGYEIELSFDPSRILKRQVEVKEEVLEETVN